MVDIYTRRRRIGRAVVRAARQFICRNRELLVSMSCAITIDERGSGSYGTVRENAYGRMPQWGKFNGTGNWVREHRGSHSGSIVAGWAEPRSRE